MNVSISSLESLWNGFLQMTLFICTVSEKKKKKNTQQKSLSFSNVWLRSVEVTGNSKCWIYYIAL